MYWKQYMWGVIVGSLASVVCALPLSGLASCLWLPTHGKRTDFRHSCSCGGNDLVTRMYFPLQSRSTALSRLCWGQADFPGVSISVQALWCRCVCFCCWESPKQSAEGTEGDPDWDTLCQPMVSGFVFVIDSSYWIVWVKQWISLESVRAKFSFTVRNNEDLLQLDCANMVIKQ